MERCNLLEKERGRVEKEERCTWETRHVHRTEPKKKKGPVGPEKEEEEDKLELFFSSVYEFHNSVPVFIPPPRCSVNSVNPVPVTQSSPSTDHSVVSSRVVLPFSPASFVSASSCIGQTQ